MTQQQALKQFSQLSETPIKFTISLDGFSGSTTYSQLMGAAQRGLTPAARATEWEISQLYQAGRLVKRP